MSLFHRASNLVGIPPEVYSKHVTPTNEDIIHNSTVNLRPISADIDGNVLSFVYNGSPLYYTDLSRTLLRLECQIVDYKGDTIPAPREVYPIPSVLTSLFLSRKITLNNTVIKSGEFYPYLGYMNDVLSLRLPFKNTLGYGANFYYDTLNNLEECAKAFAKSHTKKFQVAGYLDLPPCNYSKFIPPGVQMRFDFYRASDEFVLIDMNRMNEDAREEYEAEHNKKLDVSTDPLEPLKPHLKILSAQLEVLCLELNPKLHAHLEQRLNTSNLIFEMNRPEFNSFLIIQGTKTVVTPAMSTGDVPTRVLVMLVTQERFTGTYFENPYGFNDKNLSRIALLKNGHHIDKQYQVDFKTPHDINNNNIYIYHKLLSWLGQDHKETCGIMLDQFTSNLCCYPFDLTPGLNGYDQSSTTLITKGDLSVKLEFNAPTDTNLIMLFYCEYKSTMEVDKHRHIYINH